MGKPALLTCPWWKSLRCSEVSLTLGASQGRTDPLLASFPEKQKGGTVYQAARWTNNCQASRMRVPAPVRDPSLSSVMIKTSSQDAAFMVLSFSPRGAPRQPCARRSHPTTRPARLPEAVPGRMVGNALVGAPTQKKEPVLLPQELAACCLDHCQLAVVFRLFAPIFVSRLQIL